MDTRNRQQDFSSHFLAAVRSSSARPSDSSSRLVGSGVGQTPNDPPNESASGSILEPLAGKKQNEKDYSMGSYIPPTACALSLSLCLSLKTLSLHPPMLHRLFPQFDGDSNARARSRGRWVKAWEKDRLENTP